MSRDLLGLELGSVLCCLTSEFKSCLETSCDFDNVLFCVDLHLERPCALTPGSVAEPAGAALSRPASNSFSDDGKHRPFPCRFEMLLSGVAGEKRVTHAFSLTCHGRWLAFRLGYGALERARGLEAQLQTENLSFSPSPPQRLNICFDL